MHRIRPIELSDLRALEGLVAGMHDGLTSLPNDPDFLESKVHESIRAFYPKIRQPGGEHYLFVLEDTVSGEILGTSGLIGRVGGFDPFYSYELRQERHTHPPLAVDVQIDMLHLKANHKGPSEVCSLFLHPAARAGGLGRLLSRSRFIFVAAHRKRFANRVIAELRGWRDHHGLTPFWEQVVRPFFQREFKEADFISGLGAKSFIADLMPRHPIYVPLLPPEVQAVIGRVHRNTEPALHMLEKEGFSRNHEVDIFDAGPFVEARCSELRTVREHRELRYDPAAPQPPADDRPQLVGNARLEFRAVLCPVGPAADGAAALPADAAAALELQPGDSFLATPL